MKTVATFFISLIAFTASAQLRLSTPDLNNLVALAELYSHNNMARGDDFAREANALKTPVLAHVVEGLLAIGKGDSTLLQKQFIKRPGNDELKLWYVLREIHYNRIDTTKKPLPSLEVAQQVLAKDIDEKWLLDNYYYFMESGMAMLFNTADLSHFNFELDDMGFKNDEEKAIFFLNTMDGLANGRFRVLQYMKKNDRLLAFAAKLPLFNGKAYYYYTNLNLPDFEWIGYQKKESYNERHIGNFINTLFIHLSACSATDNLANGREIYFNSILHQPMYFKYSPAAKEALQAMYDKSK